MDRRRDLEPPGARLARSYLLVRADQGAEPQPRPRPDGLRGTTLLPRLDRLPLSSPEAHAQHRLALLARLATRGEPWFVLAAPQRQ
jgi:hypothetical protein